MFSVIFICVYVNALERKWNASNCCERSYLIRFDSRLRRTLIIDECESIDDTFDNETTMVILRPIMAYNGGCFVLIIFVCWFLKWYLTYFMNRCENIFLKWKLSLLSVVRSTWRNTSLGREGNAIKRMVARPADNISSQWIIFVCFLICNGRIPLKTGKHF